MSTTVSVGDFTVTSSDESAEDMVASLTPREEEKPQPRVIVDRGQKVDEQPKEGLSKAASELGKEGAKAAAKARKAAEKDRQKLQVTESGDEEEPDEDEAEEAPAEAAKGKEGGPTKLTADQRIRQVIDQRKAAEQRAQQAEERHQREVSELRARLERVERGEARPAGTERREAAPERPGPQGDGSDPEPQEDDYERHADFVKATALWAAREAQREAEAKAERHRYAEQHAQAAVAEIGSFRDRVGKAIQADPTLEDQVFSFEEVVRNSSHAVPSGQRYSAANVVADEILISANPARLMAHLKANEDVMRGLCTLRSRDAITREMARIETRLGNATAGTPSTRQEVSKASPPVTPVTGSPSVANAAFREDMSLDEYAKGWTPSPKR